MSYLANFHILVYYGNQRLEVDNLPEKLKSEFLNLELGLDDEETLGDIFGFQGFHPSKLNDKF